MSFSNFLENELLDHILGNAAYSAPATLYMALTTTAPTDASTGSTLVEPSGNGYTRATVTNNATNFPAASGGSKSNGTTISFPQASGAWGTVGYFAICDAITAGNVLVWGALSVAKDVTSGDTISFQASGLTVTLD